ncbi:MULTISPECIES: hypothetical protein [unclassified Hyphomicrobium]|uniref:hypothetical protein n=1 Tax=unclassified Hyphomicrobium TaxID=2619925 RepID=UPI000213E643|nr:MULTISPECIES: hypothetical protein [unclassified Hyphomicrobium]CCB64689.1 conserved exported protein of unknown function [Hyphomicrobium sp. MC1]
MTKHGGTGFGIFGAVIAVFAMALLVMPGTLAAKQTWDHVANIKDAARRLGALHQREGSAGVLKFLDACYRTQMLASEYSPGLESCLAQDYMHSQVLAQIYARIPQADRVRMGTPAPEDIARGMGARFVAAFRQYKISTKQAEALKKMIDKDGMPIFLKAVFPPRKPGEADSDDTTGSGK